MQRLSSGLENHGSLTAMNARLPMVVLLILVGSLESAAVAQVKPATEDSTKDLFNVRRDFNVLIPMRDGVKLAADIVRPDAAGRFPAIVARTPYGKVSKEASKQAEYFARHGYVYVNQDVRGRFDSQGEFEISHVFPKGHRIRVEIASGYLPIFARNLNTGENNLTTTATRTAEQTVFHDSAHASLVTLPVVPR